MPIKPTYPGVYIEEIPSGVRSITGVSTSVAAFIDGFTRGPMNKPVQLLSLTDFERELGGLNKDSPASYAIQQFFINGGTECWVVRVGQGTIAAAKGSLTDTTMPGLGAPVASVSAGRLIRDLSVPDPGLWGNALHVEIDHATADPKTLFNLSVAEIVLEGGRRVTRNVESFRNLTHLPALPNSAFEVVNDGSRLIQFAAAPTALPAASGTEGSELTAPIAAGMLALKLQLKASASAPVSALTANLVLAAVTPAAEAAQALEALLHATATSLSAALQFLLADASVTALRSATGTRLHIRLGQNSKDFDPGASLSFVSDPDSTALGLHNAVVRPQALKLGSGDDGTLPLASATALVGTATTGLAALDDVDLINILCIPAAADLADPSPVYAAATAYAEKRRAFLIVDVPGNVRDLPGMQAWMAAHDGLRHKNAAIYFPRTRIPDLLNESRPRSIAASGTIAGLYARTDTERGVWKAPAGTDARLRNVLSLDALLTDPQNGALNPLGVNCLRSFPVYSNICWGARTLAGADVQASEWKYIPVRRLTLYLEESLYRGSKWVVFEPNDEPLWAQIRLNVGAFMHTLFRQGAFQGTTPREAYLVKCDKETTTQNDIDNGIVNILVGFAPLKPAEFVIIKIQQMAGDIQT